MEAWIKNNQWARKEQQYGGTKSTEKRSTLELCHWVTRLTRWYTF
jgi:hypothetical protein